MINDDVIDVVFNDDYAIDKDHCDFLLGRVFPGYHIHYYFTTIEKLTLNYYDGYTIDFFEENKEKAEPICKKYQYLRRLLGGSFHRRILNEDLQDCNDAIDVYKRFLDNIDIKRYYRYVSCYKEVLELFLSCKTTEDFFKASYKYMLYNLLRNNLVANYLGLISDYNFIVEWEDGLGLANYYSLNLNNDIALSDLDEMIDNIVYSDNDKEWTTANEQAKLALEEKYDKPLFLKLIVKTMVKLYKGEIQDDNLKITLMRLSYGCGYQRFRSYFYHTAMWYAKKKKHLTVRPDKYLLKYLIKLNPDVKIESIEDFCF